jgi:NTE family protein
MSAAVAPRIAVTLNASFLGYATHAGFLAQLHQSGIKPVEVGGSSAGAIAAGLYAAGLTQEKIRETVLSFDFRTAFIRKTPWFKHYLWDTVFHTKPGLFVATGALDYLHELFDGERLIENLREPGFMTAVSDLDTHQTHFLQSGSLAHAMVASMCVPTVFTPLKYRGMDCFDGGIAHEAPLDPWLERPDIDVILMHRIRHTPRPEPRFMPGSLIHVTAQSHACASELLLQYRLKLAQMHGKKVIIYTTQHDRPALFSGRDFPSFYAAGEKTAAAAITDLLGQL